MTWIEAPALAGTRLLPNVNGHRASRRLYAANRARPMLLPQRALPAGLTAPRRECSEATASCRLWFSQRFAPT
jgi:hypothetical protein